MPAFGALDPVQHRADQGRLRGRVLLPVVVAAALQPAIAQRLPRPHGPAHVAAFAVDRDTLVRPHLAARRRRRVGLARGAAAAAQQGAEAAGEVDRRQQVVGGVMGARVWLQALRAGGLRQHRGGARRTGEGEHRLQAMGSLISAVHAAAGVDEAHLAEGALRHQALQPAARGVIVKLMVDRHLQRGGARQGRQRGAVGAVDGDRLLHDRGRDAGGRHLLQHLQPRARRGVDVHHVGPLAGQHLAVVAVAGGNPVVGGQPVPGSGGARRHRHQPGARLVAVGQRVVARAGAARADDHAPVAAAHDLLIVACLGGGAPRLPGVSAGGAVAGGGTAP